jgi:hypothetical protein
MNGQTVSMGLGALGAVGAACFTWWYARIAGRTAKARLVLHLLDEYKRPETRAAMERLRQWKETVGPDFAREYGRRVKAHDSTVDDLKEHRRQLKYFFQSIRALCQQRLLDEATLEATFSLTPFQFYLDVVEPMSREHTAVTPDVETHDTRTRDFVQKFVNRRGKQ